ncbi:MAG: phytanoyl-CoA dioxygenase family protein [Opitutaceae bacterium]|nr:phytanoyl-CoA dioxygenase family protein [Opitutaceae bacterium]
MTATALPQIQSYGHILDADDDKIGEIRDSSDLAGDFDALRQRFKEDGYILLRGFHDRELVLEARRNVTEKMEKDGILNPDFPTTEGVLKEGVETAFKPEYTKDNPAMMDVLYGERMIDFYTNFFEEEVRHYDYTWFRAVGKGKGTNPHCDLPYMGRGTHKHMTCWTPFGDITYDIGGLIILENSQNRHDLTGNYMSRDVDGYCENKPSEVERAKKEEWVFSGTLSRNPVMLRNKFSGRWLVSEYQMGDILTFGMGMVHASLDNQTNFARLSSDSRYQKASEAIDDRWIGENPPGHKWAGKRGRIC